MKRYLFIIATFLLLAMPLTTASAQASFGVGLGSLYSGMGANLALRSTDELRYLSAGCIAVGYSDSDGTITACGVGAGWLWTGLFAAAGHNQALGLYLGPVGWRGRHYVGDKGRTIYGAGISYAYFFSGIDASGWNLGATLAAGFEDEASGYLLLQAGYQF